MAFRMDLARFWDVTTATAASAARPNFGNRHYPRTKTPERSLEIYEFEVCPYCRIAREALSALSLSPIVYPCPKGGKRFADRHYSLWKALVLKQSQPCQLSHPWIFTFDKNGKDQAPCCTCPP